ncbi:MAG: hypothetical protein JSR62_06465 [Nitrospira sp.]|nr:hypothetical protein [Nitrospira sp.]
MNDYLLVPTNVQAFVVGKPAADPLYDLAPVPRTTDDLKSWYRDRKYAFSFEGRKLTQKLESGIHLHWALPTALTQARHEGDKAPVQPCIPNRWLVLRLGHAAGNPTISSKAWVVESDYVDDSEQSGGTPFLFFSPSLAVKYVGRTVPLEQWQDTQSAYRFELTASGWGDPSFAAYYPACKGVLGFHDKMEGVAQGQQLTYLVLGWYSDQAKDPFHPIDQSDIVNSCQARLAGLGWSCPDLEAGALPQRTLCHGAVVGLTWQGAGQTYPSTPAGSTSPTVAIGGSAAEAVAALMARNAPTSPDVTDRNRLEHILCAFQHGQATQVADHYQLGELLHRHGFNAVAGGTSWSIEPIARSAEAQQPLPALSADVLTRLDALNQAQQRYDRHAREIESLRSQLFACWVTWARMQTGPPPRRPGLAPVTLAQEKLNQAVHGLPQYQQEVDRCKARVRTVLTEQQTGMQLVESTMPPFLHPKDPFVVMKGENLVGPARVSATGGDQNTISLVRCRPAKAVVSGVSQSGMTSATWSADTYFSVPNVAGVRCGDLARKLALEALLFDPSCSSAIPTADDRLFQALQKSLDQSSQSGLTTLTWSGKTPDSLAVTRWGETNPETNRETNPWLPLYLMWQVRWASAYTPAEDSANRHSTSLDGWRFGSGPLTGDLVPPGASPNIAGTPLDLEDATIVLPLSGAQLAKHLREFAETAGRDVDNLTSITQTEVLGQSLGGFNDQLLRQTLGLCLPPVNPTSTQVDASMWEAMGKGPQPTLPVIRTFLPVRAGALALVNLYLVDTFGQVRKLIDSSPGGSPATMIASAELSPTPSEYHASFSPRLPQPARLNVEWQSADASASGPVCGWMVPNFLEKSFALFSANGEPLGALESVLPASGEKTIHSPVTFKWRPRPGSTLQISGISNERLKRFVQLATEFSADEGQAFLEMVELVLRKTEARLPLEDPTMAVLLGRPLALVHASLDLELQGLPAGYWKTDGTWTFETEGVETLRVPVRLGGMALPADGLVGYVPENGAPCLVASDGATRRLGNSARITYDQQLSVACAGDPVTLTLLMDASARVHASTGILPRHAIQLPAEVSKQLDLIKEFYIAVAPVLGAGPEARTAQPTMPRPSDAFGQWSWATRPAVDWRAITQADDRARFAEGLTLSEGWLKLRLKRDQHDAVSDKQT